ncbi:MAG: beta strand repeat-containing protein, partial [Bacteroidota bacterium]
TTSSTQPASPSNGSTYTVGASALGGVIVYQGTGLSFTDNTVSGGVGYYYWVYSYNTSTTCQVAYNVSTPLNGNVTTLSCPPTVNAVQNQIICKGSSNTISFTGTVTGTVFSWTNDNTATGISASGTGNINFTATNSSGAAITSTITVTPSYTSGGVTCNGDPVTFTVTVNPCGQVNTVTNQVLCNGSATSAVTFSTTNNGLISTGGTQTASSGTISVSVPDASAAGATHTIPVNLPTGAVINNMRVTMNMTHTWISDMVINLKAPNGQILNLFNQHGGSGDNLVNTVVSSTGTTAFSSGSAPFTGTFAATAASGQGPTGNVSNSANFAALYSTPNGNWVLAMRDLFGGDLGVLTSWSISIDYTVQGTFGTNMNWTNSTTSIGLGASGTGNIPSFTAVNNGSAPVTSTVTVTPVYFNGGTSCPGTPTTFTYTVNPTATVNAVANQVFCAGSLSTVNFSGNATGTVYSWTNSNTAIGLAASGTGSLSFTPTNTGTTPIIATITVTPSFTNGGVTCTGTPRTFTITVNPVGQVNAVTSQVLCNGSNTTAVNFATVNGGGTIVAGTPVVTNSGTIAVVVPDANSGGASHTIPVTLPAGATVTGVSVNFNMNHTWVSDMVFNLKAPNGQILNLVNRRGGAGVNFTNTTISSAGTASLATGTAPFT